MERPNLIEVQPTIFSFRRAVSGVVKRGVYDKTHAPRAYDALIYILHGNTRYTFSDYTINAKAGDILYLSKGSIYSMEVLSEHYDFLFADFLFVHPEDAEFFSFSIPAADGKGTEKLFHRLLTAWYIRRDTVITDCLSLLYAIYSDCIRAFRDSSYISPEKRRRLEDSLRYIDEHLFDKTLSVESVAAAVQMHASYFRKTFTEVYKMPPRKYIGMERMIKARQKLRYSDIPIAAIAEELGFSNPYYFSRAFKKENGCTPSEYRYRYSDFPVT